MTAEQRHVVVGAGYAGLPFTARLADTVSAQRQRTTQVRSTERRFDQKSEVPQSEMEMTSL